MDVHVSHRHDCWDDAMELCVEEEISRLEGCLERFGLRPTALHVTVTQSGHLRTECSIRLSIPGLVLPARVSSLAMDDAVCRCVDELVKQVEHHGRTRHVPVFDSVG